MTERGEKHNPGRRRTAAEIEQDWNAHKDKPGYSWYKERDPEREGLFDKGMIARIRFFDFANKKDEVLDEQRKREFSSKADFYHRQFEIVVESLAEQYPIFSHDSGLYWGTEEERKSTAFYENKKEWSMKITGLYSALSNADSAARLHKAREKRYGNK